MSPLRAREYLWLKQNNTAAWQKFITHEKAHIYNPLLNEGAIERMTPTDDVRAALSMFRGSAVTEVHPQPGTGRGTGDVSVKAGPSLESVPWDSIRRSGPGVNIPIAGAAFSQFVTEHKEFTLSHQGKTLKAAFYRIEGKAYIQYGDRWVCIKNFDSNREIPLREVIDTQILLGR